MGGHDSERAGAGTENLAAAQTREQFICRAFVALADTLVDDYDVIELLTRLVGYSVTLLGADAAAIMLADPNGQLRTVAASSEDARLAELMQLQADQGPCLDCYRAAAAVNVTDLPAAADRWPIFVAEASRQPTYHAVHAVPLRLRGNAVGALNLFHHHPTAMHADDLALGQALADVATVAILQERAIRRGEVVNDQLRSALSSRVIIEQAKGVLAQHSGLSMDRAFELLRRYARDHRLRLADVAADVATRTLTPNTIRRNSPTADPDPT
jgi:GAF domain-containing protein